MVFFKRKTQSEEKPKKGALPKERLLTAEGIRRRSLKKPKA